MSEPEDTWPLPEYNPGPRKHLHALGVISLCYNAFEQTLARLYQHHPMQQRVPADLARLYYFGLDEKRRLVALKTIFKAYEQEAEMSALIENITNYFEWCWACRNKLMHAEPYPSTVDVEGTLLHLSKPKSKFEPEPNYMWPGLKQLRDIADRIVSGDIQAATISIYLRVRDIPSHQRKSIPEQYKHPGLPPPLEIPSDLALSEIPYLGPKPEYLRRS